MSKVNIHSPVGCSIIDSGYTFLMTTVEPDLKVKSFLGTCLLFAKRVDSVIFEQAQTTLQGEISFFFHRQCHATKVRNACVEKSDFYCVNIE